MLDLVFLAWQLNAGFFTLEVWSLMRRFLQENAEHCHPERNFRGIGDYMRAPCPTGQLPIAPAIPSIPAADLADS